MRFAWLREHLTDDMRIQQSTTNRLILNTYDIIWWIPIVLPFTGIIDYQTGFIAFFAITVIMALANLYRNNVLDLKQAESFPLRAP
jgi:hypothetical protein